MITTLHNIWKKDLNTLKQIDSTTTPQMLKLHQPHINPHMHKRTQHAWSTVRTYTMINHKTPYITYANPLPVSLYHFNHRTTLLAMGPKSNALTPHHPLCWHCNGTHIDGEAAIQGNPRRARVWRWRRQWRCRGRSGWNSSGVSISCRRNWKQ